MVVRLASIPGGRLEKRRPGSLPDTAAVEDKHLDRGYADLILFLREEQGLITQGTLKGRETCGRARTGVAGIFKPHKLLAPGGGVGRDEATKSLLAPTGYLD